jgi:hypothetical protein
MSDLPTLTAFLTGIAVGAFGLAGVAVALFALCCHRAKPMDEDCR